MLPLKECAQRGEGAQRLQITRARWKILARLDMGRSVESPEASKLGPLCSDICNLQQSAARQLLLQAPRPLLNIGRYGIPVHSEIAEESGRARLRKPVFDGEHRRR